MPTSAAMNTMAMIATYSASMSLSQLLEGLSQSSPLAELARRFRSRGKFLGRDLFACLHMQLLAQRSGFFDGPSDPIFRFAHDAFYGLMPRQ